MPTNGDLLANGPGEHGIEELFSEYVDRLNAGEILDHEEIRLLHPSIADELFERLEEFEGLFGDTQAPETLGTLGDYTLRRQIGRGGMGVVYEAWEGSMDRVVALKVLPAGVAADDRAFQRFMREAKTAGKLNHPHVVGVYSTGVKEGTPWYAMEYVEGETLAQVLARLKEAEEDTETVFGKQGELAFFSNVARAFADVADGLQHAHSNGVIHRDIKPSNLILDRDGRLRILDFGLARLEGQESLTLSGDFVGTPAYMSPEQARRRKIPVDHRTDIYSLGATLYELVTSKPPFKGKDHQDTLSQIIEQDPRSPRQLNARVPQELETIVLRCLRKDAGDRYGTAEALGQDLRRFVRGDAIEARAQAPWVRLRRRAWRNRTRLFVTAAAVLALFSFALLLNKHFDDLRRQEAEIHAERMETYKEKVLSAVMKIAIGRPKRESDDPRRADRRGEDRRRQADSNTAEQLDPPLPAAHAASELREAIEIFPERSDAHYHLARALRILGMRDAALEELSVAIDLDQHFVPARTLKKALLDNEDASQEDDKQTEEDTWAKAWHVAHRAERTENWKEAIDAYTALIGLETVGKEPYLGASIETRLGRGKAYLQAELYARALVDFAAAEGQWPEALEPAVLTAKTLYRMGKKEPATDRFERLFARAPPGFESAVALEIADVYYKDDAAESLRWTQRAEESPFSSQVAARLLRRLGRLDEALSSAERAVQLAPDDAGAHYTLAGLLVAQRRFEEAVREYGRVLELGRNEAYVYNDLGLALKDSGELEQAIPELRKATEVDPTYAQAHHNLGLALMEARKPQEGIAALREAAELKSTHGTCEQLGIALRKTGEFEEALAWLRKARELEPTCAEGHLLVARTEFDLKRPEEAIVSLRGGIEAVPKNRNIRRNLGRLLEQLGRLDAAAAELEELARLLPESTTENMEFARILLRQGKLDEAAEQYEKVFHIHEGRLVAKPRDLEVRHRFYHVLVDLVAGVKASGRSHKVRRFATRSLAVLGEVVEMPGATAHHLNDYAWELLTSEVPELQDPETALRYARKASELTEEKDAGILDTLALSQSRTGHREQAVKTQTRALELLPAPTPGKRDGMREEMEARLQEFQNALKEHGEEKVGRERQ